MQQIICVDFLSTQVGCLFTQVVSVSQTTYIFFLRICCLRVPCRAKDVEVCNDDVVIREFKKEVRVWCEIAGTAGEMGDVNVNIVFLNTFLRLIYLLKFIHL